MSYIRERNNSRQYRTPDTDVLQSSSFVFVCLYLPTDYTSCKRFHRKCKILLNINSVCAST